MALTTAGRTVGAGPAGLSERSESKAGAWPMGLRPSPHQYRLDRLEDDVGVQRHRQVLDVEQVVLELLHRVLDAGAVGVAHLRPAGQPGLHHVPLPVERDLHRQVVDELRPLGARTYHCLLYTSDAADDLLCVDL